MVNQRAEKCRREQGALERLSWVEKGPSCPEVESLNFWLHLVNVDHTCECLCAKTILAVHAFNSVFDFYKANPGADGINKILE